jgi:hypothetical protein
VWDSSVANSEPEDDLAEDSDEGRGPAKRRHNDPDRLAPTSSVRNPSQSSDTLVSPLASPAITDVHVGNMLAIGAADTAADGCAKFGSGSAHSDHAKTPSDVYAMDA